MVFFEGDSESDDPGSLEEDLLAVLKVRSLPSSLVSWVSTSIKSTVPSSPDGLLVVDLSEAQPICSLFPLSCKFEASDIFLVDSNVVFWVPEVKVGESAAFQLSLTAPQNVVISSLPFTSLAVHFSGKVAPIVVRHAPLQEERPPAVQRVDLGHTVCSADETPHSLEANLRWQPRALIIFTGTLASDIPTTLQVCFLPFMLIFGAFSIHSGLKTCIHHQ